MQYLVIFLLAWLIRAADFQQYGGIKLAANDFLLVFYQKHTELLQHHCSSSAKSAKVISNKFHLPVHSVAIGKTQNESQLYFVVSGLSAKFQRYMSKVTVNCEKNEHRQDAVFFNESTHYDPDYFVVAVASRGQFAIGFTNSRVFIYNLNSLQSWAIEIDWPNSSNFLPFAVDIDSRFIFVAGFARVTDEIGKKKVAPKVYLMSITASNGSDYNIQFHDSWSSEQSFRNQPETTISISVNGDAAHTRILLGIPSANTVHLFSVNESIRRSFLHHISSKTVYHGIAIHTYGRAVAWLNKGQKAVVLDDFGEQYDSSILYLYDMLSNMQLINNETVHSSTFPNDKQVFEYSKTKYLFITATVSNPSTLYLYNNSFGNIFALPPSQPGYHSVQSLSPEHSELSRPLLFLVPNSAQCPPRTYKNDSGIWPCSPCNNSELHHNDSSGSQTCVQCTNKSFCPGEFPTNIEQFEDVNQNSAYPESPEIDVFDDIILYQMFRTDCHMQSPFFVSIVVLGVVLIISILIYLMKLSKRLQLKQQYLMILFRHLDLIGQGELWFGGLISIALLLLVGFASKFSYSYHYQYPIEKQQLYNDKSCQSSNLLNSKFETSLQFLSSPPGQLEQAFNLLNSQIFVLQFEIIHSLFHCGLLALRDDQRKTPLSFACLQNGTILYVTAKLPAHNMNLILSLQGNHTIEAVRIGLSASASQAENSWAQELNFSKRFNQTGRWLSQTSAVSLQLTKVINITESLTDSDETLYTGLWLPTFTFHADQLFSEEEKPNNLNRTRLSISISETSFFVRNKQEPIARRSEIIFHTILFVGVCIDLIGIVLLLLRLWLMPIIRLLIKKVFWPSSGLCHLLDGNEKTPHQMILMMEKKLTSVEQKNEVLSTRMNALIEHLIDRQQNEPFLLKS